MDFGDFGFWILDFGDFGFWILDRYVANLCVRPPTPQIWGILDFGFWILAILGILGILDFGFWGFWILDFGFWGFWILDFRVWGFWILDFVTNFGFYIRRRLCTPIRVGGLSTLKAIFFGISVFPFFVRVHIFWLIIFQVVKVESTHFHKVRELSSVVFLEENLHAGRRLETTIDLFSLIGMCVMVHSDPMVLSNDLDQIRSMEHNGALFALAN